MLRHFLAPTCLVCVLASIEGTAHAAGAWVQSGPFNPIEQRVAVALGPSRTTLWTSLSFEAATGPVGLVVPAPSGASLDISSDAWFEALSVATAPRVFPPDGVSPYCPGETGPVNIFEIAGAAGHRASPKVEDVEVLDDVAKVAAWAQQGGLTLAPDVEAALGALSGVRFVAVRFQAPGGPSVTPTLRIAMPGAPPLLPLTLTHAAEEDLRVTAWFIGEGRVSLQGATATSVASESLTWDAKAKKSDYSDELHLALDAAGVNGAVLECANHEALSSNLSIANGTASIDGLVTTFFERASAYGDAAADPSGCIFQAAVALASSSPVSASCARADLGVVDGGAKCVEAPAPGELDPQKLRCGVIADDLAVALGSLTPSKAWLSREALQIPAGKAGASFALSLSVGKAVSPVRIAQSVDVGDCGGGSSSGSGTNSGAGAGSGSSSSGGSSSTGSYGGPPLPDNDPSTDPGQTNGSGSGVGSSVDVGVDVDVPVETSCDSASVPESAGDSSDSCDSEETGGDSCDGGDTGGDSCDGGDTGGDSCDGGEGFDSCDSGEGFDSCDSGGDVSCDGGGGDCSINGKSAHKRRGPKLSPMALGILALLAPMRRRGRRARGREGMAAPAWTSGACALRPGS